MRVTGPPRASSRQLKVLGGSLTGTPSLKNRRMADKSWKKKIRPATGSFPRMITLPLVTRSLTEGLQEAAHAPVNVASALTSMFAPFGDPVFCRGPRPEVWRRACFALCAGARLAACSFRAEQRNLQRLRLDYREYPLAAHSSRHHRWCLAFRSRNQLSGAAPQSLGGSVRAWRFQRSGGRRPPRAHRGTAPYPFACVCGVCYSLWRLSP